MSPFVFGLVACTVARIPSTHDAPTTDAPSTRAEFSLSAAVEFSLEHNARLQVAAAAALAAEERAIAAGRREPIRLSLNPATVLNQAASFIGEVLGVSKKRKYASRAARHELAAVLASNEEFRLELIAAVKVGYWSIRLGERSHALLSDEASRAERLVESAKRQAAEGAITHREVDEALGMLAEARAGERWAGEELAAEQARFRLLLGLPPDASLVLTDEPSPAPATLPDAETLARIAEARRPVIAQATALVGAAEAGIGLARAERRPEVTLGAAFDELQAFGFANIEFPLLDFGSIRHNIRATQAERKAAEAELVVLRQELRVELETAVHRLRAAEAQLRAVAGDIVPAAQRQAEGARRRHDSGAVSADGVLAAESRLGSAVRALHEAQLDVLAAQVGIERALGIGLSELPEAVTSLTTPPTEERPQ